MEIEQKNQCEVSSLVENSSADAKKIALHFAILMNNDEIIRLLLNNGAIPATRSLEFAILSTGPVINPIMRMVVASAGDTIDVKKEIDSVNNFLCTLLNCSYDEIQVELSGVENCLRNQQRLFKAVKNEDIKDLLAVCHYLSAHNQKAELNEQDHLGNTVLHYAALNSNAPQVCILLSHNANPGILNCDGKTAHEYMAAGGRTFLESVYRLCRLREIRANRVA